MRVFVLFLFINSATAHDSYCFKKHIKESIHININIKKMGYYSKLTQGKSDKIFRKLISSERLSLLPAVYFDLNALKYQKSGIDLLCKEFISLKDMPDLSSGYNFIPKEEFKNFSPNFFQKIIMKGVKTKNLDLITFGAREALKELKKQPDYFCFQRHFFESIYRFAYFLPLRVAQAKKAKLKDPTKLLLNIIKIQAIALNSVYNLDKESLPIQRMGIPILCNELPNLLEDLNIPKL
jgi:hypothetical protein